jgi:hypothetical protein
MSHDNWYAETAYDSRKKKDVPPPEPAGWGDLGERSLRAHVLPLGVHCGDYRYAIMKESVQDLKEGVDHGMTTHEQYPVGSICNPMLAVALFRWLGGVLSVICFLATFLMFDADPTLSAYDLKNYLFFLVPFSIFLSCTILIKFVPNKNNILFNRSTGMVTIPQLGRKPNIVLPFAECDGYYFCPQSKTGWTYNLYLGHRFTPQGTVLTEQRSERHVVNADWEFFQHYMDTSLPLPDIPDLEPYRHLDPTTAAYDKEHNRPPHYWRDFDLFQFRSEILESLEVIERFPWERLPTDHIPQEIKDKVPRIAKMLS